MTVSGREAEEARIDSAIEWARQFAGPGSNGVNELADLLVSERTTHESWHTEWAYRANGVTIGPYHERPREDADYEIVCRTVSGWAVPASTEE